MSDSSQNALLQALALPALVVATSERILLANTAADALFGAATAGKLLPQVLRHPEFLASFAKASTSPPRTHIKITLQQGERFSADLLVDFARIAEGPEGAVLITFTDLSETSLATRMRRDFVANVSHELRTPLTAIRGFLETLQGPARHDAEARSRFIGIMQSETERMTRLVDDLLSLSRVEEDQRRRPLDPVDLAAVARDVAAMLGEVAARSGTRINLVCPDPLDDIPGDAAQLRQVIVNLVENAVKYGGGKGPVDLSLQVSGVDTIRLRVSDRGEGIAPEHLPRLTERFYRVDRHRSREVGGTGLGLAIVKHIVQRHRGTMQIESIEGKGTTVTIDLPRRWPAANVM